MSEQEKLTNQSIYHRQKPVREFDLYQTLYTTVKNVNKDNLHLNAIGYLGTNITFAKLLKNVDRLADAYSKAGIKEGDTVAICTINMPLVQENLLALSKLGATSKWIDLRIKGKELVKNINESDCRIIVVFEGILPVIKEIIEETHVENVLVASPKDYLSPIIRIIANIKDKKDKKHIALPQDKRFMRYKKFIKSGDFNSNVKPVEFKKDRPSIIVQSSGSTGIAKSIVHTEYNFNSMAQKDAYTDVPVNAGKTIYIAIPPFVIYGLNNAIYASLALGMKAEMTPYVSESTVFDDLGKYDFACGAPLHYRYLYNKLTYLKKHSTNDYLIAMQKLKRVKCFISGGDKISVKELLTMQHFLETPIINAYGNNELAGGVTAMPVYASKPDSVGVTKAGITIASFEVESNNRLGIGIQGEICVSSDAIFSSYLNNIEETKKIKQIHSDGLEWVHTGDLGYVDSDGYVYITGRAKRLIKREAFKIAPDTIENVILKVEEVKDCVVVGVTDLEHESSSVPLAYVEVQLESAESFDIVKEKIETKCIEELPDYELPRYILSIDKIPYNNAKKAFKQLEIMGEEYVKNLK